MSGALAPRVAWCPTASHWSAAIISLRPSPVADQGVLDGLICFCHLRWSFVWQRPQHILTRLASRTDVIVVEEPEIAVDAEAIALRTRRADGLTIVTPVLPVRSGQGWGFHDSTNCIVARLLDSYLTESGWTVPGRRNAVWYYTPMALGATPPSVTFETTVYDVMDELANFQGAPADLKRRERDVLDAADVVFTGGPSLYSTRASLHPRISCHPSGVETSHFASARSVSDLPADIASLPRPIVGFYGVIDERLDIELLAGAATARPDWSFVLIGPVVKIDPTTLPQRPNIHYLGMRDYDHLPVYLAGFDVAILPLARNAATRFISPTKTLEYLAGGRPVVSTPIEDVAELYGDVVAIADGVEEFVVTIEGLLEEPPEAREARRQKAAETLSRFEWDAIVDRMWNEIVTVSLASKGI